MSTASTTITVTNATELKAALSAATGGEIIELAAGNFGSDYPDGLFVAQDGQNAPEAQNFKLVSWKDIKAALGLE